MAKVELASFLKSVNGRLGKIVLYNTYGREYARVYVKPENPDTDAQKIVRKTFGNAVRSWQSLPAEEKHEYNKKAHRNSISGYNLYISIYMKDNLSQRKTNKENRTLFMASFRHSDSIQTACSSVASPFYLMDRPLLPYIQAVSGSAMG